MFGTIYRAKSTENGELAAIKVLRFCNAKELEEISKERDALILCTDVPFVVNFLDTFIIPDRTLSGINDLWVCSPHLLYQSFRHTLFSNF